MKIWATRLKASSSAAILLCFVNRTWGIDTSKAVIGRVSVARTTFRKWKLDSNWLNAEKEYGSVLAAVCGGGEMRDETKNGCVAD